MPDTLDKRLAEYLPAIYQEPAAQDKHPFVDAFLAAFESVLLGIPSDSQPDRPKAEEMEEAPEDVPALKETVARLHALFDPNRTPEGFLPWLASWTALALRADLSSERKRKLIARMIPLYRIRGTRKYVEELLALHLEAMPAVTDFEIPALEIGSHSMVGDDTCLGGGPPHFFRVFLVAPLLQAEALQAQCAMARSVIELAKPAHTYYELEVASPHLEVGVRSRLGLDTVLSPVAG